MLVITKQMTMSEFAPWAGAQDTYDKLVDADKLEAFEEYLEELYPEGIDETALNDILWFESDWVFESVGLTEDGDLPD